MAEAEAEALRRVAAALPQGEASMYLLGLKYLEALPRMTEGRGTTIFLPAEAAGVLGAVGGLRGLLTAAGGLGAGDAPPASRPPAAAGTAAAPSPQYTPPIPGKFPRTLADSGKDSTER